MKIVFCLILLSTHFACLAQLSVDLVSGDKITFQKANADAFKTTIKGDSVIIKQLLFDRLDGLGFDLSSNPESIRIKYELDFFQYTIDDNPSGPIGLSFWTDYKALSSSTLPDHYGSYENSFRTFNFLGFNRQSELGNFYFKSYPELKARSLEVQRNFYSGLVDDEQFKKCCPEYIKQATEFLSSDERSFESLESLSLELVFKSTIMEITYPSGTKYVRINR